MSKRYALINNYESREFLKNHINKYGNNTTKLENYINTNYLKVDSNYIEINFGIPYICMLRYSDESDIILKQIRLNKNFIVEY